jgi:hypothetical protein
LGLAATREIVEVRAVNFEPRPIMKDPAQRFRTPDELVKAMPTITGAIDVGRRITRQSLQKASFTGSRVGTRKPPAKPAPEKISVARLPVTGSDLFGREEDIAFLDRAWAKKDVNVVLFVVPDGKLKKAAT